VNGTHVTIADAGLISWKKNRKLQNAHYVVHLR
jgi:hypothetical protein